MSIEKSICPQTKYDRSLRFQQEIGSPVGRQFNATQVQSAIRKFPVSASELADKVQNQENNNTKKKPELTYEQYNKRRFISYENWLSKKGLLDNDTDRRRFNTYYIDINSAARNTKEKIIMDEVCQLDKNPLVFKPGSNKIFIKHPNSKFEDGAQIILNNVSTKQVILRTFDDDENPAFEILPKSSIMKIFYPHNLPSSLEYPITVELKGIKGDNKSYLGNLPINIINCYHKLYTNIKLKESDDLEEDWFDYNSNCFFIKLPMSLKSSYNLSEYNFKVVFHTVAGIPLNLLNNNCFNNCHTVSQVSKKGYYIQIPGVCAVDNVEAGGNCIEISKILSICPSYPNPNKYTIGLGKTFHNVISTRIISSEFPNISRTVQNPNTKLHWNTIDGGETIFSISVPQGNYTPTQLQNKLEELFKIQDKNSCILVDLDATSSCATFKSYKKFILTKPFVDIDPEININPELDAFNSDSSFTITVKHPNHEMIGSNNSVVVSNSLSHLGISSDILNKDYTVIIVDEDTYTITISKTNLDYIRKDTKGGVSVTILVPTLFRLRLDQDNSMGTVIGFADVGESGSITEFSTILSNKDLYVNSCNISNNCSFQFNTDKYIMMVADPLITLESIGPTKRAFAKIRLATESSILGPLVNTFVPTSTFYDDPLNEIYELRIEFFTEDGHLVDFDCQDHSFTIEINTVHDIPGGTGISANTGKNYNVGV